MDEFEEIFREGLRDAVSNRPALDPVVLDDVIAEADRPVRRRPVGRWVGLAAAVSVAAGIGVWAVQSSSHVPTDARVPGTSAGAGQVQTLRVQNRTGIAYRNAALQLADGRSLPLGDLPAGGTVLVPMDGASSAAASPASDVLPGVQVSYSGQCTDASGHQVSVVVASGPSGQASFEVAVPSGTSTDDEKGIMNVTVAPTVMPTPGDVHNTDIAPTFPAPQAGPSSGTLVPLCTVTITEPQRTPEPKHT